MNTDLPPEAFTKETLQAAFDWLQTQPEVVKGAIHTPENLVSLYRKAQRLNDLDHPVSSKKFVTDLKTLATSLDQFSDSPQVLDSRPQQTQQHRPTQSQAQPQQPSQPQQQPQPQEPMTEFTQSQKTSFEVKASTESTTTSVSSKSSSLDALTNQRISEVQRRFNLSDSNEAIRLLVSLGYEKFSDFS